MRNTTSPCSEKSCSRGWLRFDGSSALGAAGPAGFGEHPQLAPPCTSFRHSRHPPNILSKACTSTGPTFRATLSCLCSPDTWQGAPSAEQGGMALGTVGVGARAVGRVNVSYLAIQDNLTGAKSLLAINCTESPGATPLPPQKQLPCLQPGPDGPYGWSKGGLPVIS